MDSIQVWHTHPGLRLPAARVQALAGSVLEAEHVRWSYVGIILSRQQQIHDMNRDFLGHDYPTDVLSFPVSGEGEILEGEVYVDLDTARSNASEFGTSFAQEAARYVIHGLLHLAGHDDSSTHQRAAMRQLEDRYLGLFWD